MNRLLERSILTLLVGLLLGACTADSPPDTDAPTESVQEVSEAALTPTEAASEEEPLAAEVPPTEEAVVAEESAVEIEPESWIRHIGDRDQSETIQDLELSEDGSYLILGSSNIQFDGERRADLYLARMEADGTLRWEKNISVDGLIHPVYVQETEDGGYYISGVIGSADTDGTDIFALRLDSERNELSREIFGGPLDEFGSALPVEDGGYLLGGTVVDPDDFVANPGAAGYGGQEGRSNIYFARVDAEGSEIWSHAFGDELNVQSSSAVPAPDGDFMLVGNIMYYPETGDDIILLRIDTDGEIVWSRTWEEGSMTAFDLLATSDGNFLITGAIDRKEDDPGDPKADCLLIKVDQDGNEIWNRTYGDPEMTEYAKVVGESTDGTYVVAGEYVTDLYSGDADIAVLKIDADGELIWQEVIDNNGHTMFTDLIQHPDGGYVIAGSVARNYQFDILLVKTDAQGQAVD